MAGSKEGVDMVMSGEKLEKLNLSETENVGGERPPGLTNTVWGQQSLVGPLFSSKGLSDALRERHVPACQVVPELFGRQIKAKGLTLVYPLCFRN
jgi:hypothetical protein